MAVNTPEERAKDAGRREGGTGGGAATFRRPDWGHLAFVAGVAAVVLLYLNDAIGASPQIDNLILILPAAVVALVLCAIVAVGALRRRVPTVSPATEKEQEAGSSLPLMALFAVYVAALPWLGFDVGSALFIAGALAASGERRPVSLLLVPIAFAVLATLAFRLLVPYPLPTLIL